MNELTALCESLSFSDVRTYIQSGNVVFKSAPENIADLAELIGKEIERAFGFSVAVFIRTPEDLQSLIARNPFLAESGNNPDGHYICFLKKAPGEGNLNQTETLGPNLEMVRLDGRELFLYYPNGYGKSKWTTNYFEKKLDQKATTRNWRTVLKLTEMCG